MIKLSNYNKQDTDRGKEALINEFKGNIFEYLVGITLARHFLEEEKFLKGIPPALLNRMVEYERTLRELDRPLLEQLPMLAKRASDQLVKTLLLQSVDEIVVVGKLPGEKKEADLIIFSKNSTYPVSLKLVKSGSFVNTKSGGIKSFISSYFSVFDSALSLQSDLNRAVDRLHVELAKSLYLEAKLPFHGGFDKVWVESGYTELPGELSEEFRIHLLNYYSALTKSLYTILNKFFKESRDKFTNSLMPILGFGHEDIIQLILFHSGVKGENRYRVKDIIVSDAKRMSLLLKDKLEFCKFKSGISSFEIRVGSKLLQIRVKPMNKFTAKALKINCSVKY